jgi:hypothetical protein
MLNCTWPSRPMTLQLNARIERRERMTSFTSSTCLPRFQIASASPITLYARSLDISKPLRLGATTHLVISLLCGLVLSWVITLLFLGLL